jgi:hypothetical protein
MEAQITVKIRDGKNNLHIDVLHRLMHRKQISMYSMYRNKKIDVLKTSIYFRGYSYNMTV